MMFASRVRKVSPSVTLGLNARTLELKKQGRDIVALGVGEPDIDTPDAVCEAGIQAIRNKVARYTATGGTPELKGAICKYVKAVYGMDYEASGVMASSGAKQVLYNAVMATVGDGDELIIPTPYWTSYPEMVYLAGATPVFVETTVEDGLKLTPGKLLAAITPRTRAILLNSPSNPTGVAYSRTDLEVLADILRSRDIWVLSDDIYCTLMFDGHEFASLAALPGMRDKTILINGVSKTFSMTGWRIGFAAGSKEVIAAMTKIQDHSTSCPNAIAQKAATEALTVGPSLTESWVLSLSDRRSLMLALVEQIPGVRAVPPQGAFYLWLNVEAYVGRSGFPKNTLELADDLLVKAGVGTIPGEAFGAPGFLRLSFAVTEKDIREGIGRMARHLASIPGACAPGLGCAG
jgi:aspartate aminotransferase